jgi:glycerol-3-phosphate acyltransferase PlsY
LWCLGAFLSGSIPFGLILVKMAGKGDVRAQGSGNIGATNVLRTGGTVLGLATLALDLLKGLVPVLLARLAGASPFLLSAVVLAAVLGHMYTPWLHFKGGKGVATALGAILAYHPAMVVPALGTFLILVLVFRYVSLGSVAAALVLLLTAFGFLGRWACRPLPPLTTEEARFVMLPWVLLAGLVIRKHTGNLGRLIRGEETPLWGRSKERTDD